MQQDRKRYPIGHFEYGKSYSLDETRQHIRDIAKLPKLLKKMARKLSGEELETPYRRDGWTARQVIHHLADSHINAYIRMKLAATTNTPAINPYDEVAWAEMEDGKHGPVKNSVALLASLHKRWVTFLHSLTVEDLEKGYFHPGMGRVFKLSEAIALYSWHGRHHLAHIKFVAQGQGEKPAKPKPSAEKSTGKATLGSLMADEAPAEKPRRGRKPKAAAEPKPRKPRTPKAPKVELTEAEKAARAAEIKERRIAIIAAARAARVAKRGDTPLKTKKTAAADDGTPKRIRRSKEEIAAAHAEQAALRAAKKAARAEKVTVKRELSETEKEALRERRVSILAAARAARLSKLEAEGRLRPPKAEQPELTEAEKEARAAELKERRIAILAAARAVRLAKKQ